MSALPESSIKKLGVIAGGGTLPVRLLAACDRDGIEPFIVAFDGQTDLSIVKGRKHMITRIGATRAIINTLRSHGITDLVLIGSIRRPSLMEMRPDFYTLSFFSRLLTRAIGDDGLLKAVKKELETQGFNLHGVQNFVHDLLADVGDFASRKPGSAESEDIQRGLDILKSIGTLDIGQGIVVQEGIVLGVEAAEGTDNLVRRCGCLRRTGRGPILVKISKPGQDSDLDLPTIGPNTVMAAGESGFSGIIIEAGKTLMLDPQKVGELADEFGMFVTAVKP